MNHSTQIILVIAAAGLLIGAWLTLEVDFPFLEYSSIDARPRLVPDEPYDGITSGVSKFLWSNRSLDLVSQSFVVLVAVICSLAMLKIEGRRR